MTKNLRCMLLATMFASVAVSAVRAQLISVRCCTEESDLARIDDCVSGPGNLDQPATCPAAATCVLGFGADTALVDALCDEKRAVPPPPFRAYCSSWIDPAATVKRECVAQPQASVSLFSVYDDDGDGDLDSSDVAVFKKVYQPVPKVEQSEAVLAQLECCVPESIIRGIGQCLSGPGVTAQPPPCNGMASCVAGFSAPVELGDWLFGLCGPPPLVPPDPATSYCLTWHEKGVSAVQFCPASSPPGNNPFVVSDADGDADVDLFDLAVFLRDWETAMTD